MTPEQRVPHLERALFEERERAEKAKSLQAQRYEEIEFLRWQVSLLRELIHRGAINKELVHRVYHRAEELLDSLPEFK